MKPIKINGIEYERLAVASSKENGLKFAQRYMYDNDLPYTDEDGRVYHANGHITPTLYVLPHKGRWYLLFSEHNQNHGIKPEKQEPAKEPKREVETKRTTLKTNTAMKKKSACSSKKTSKRGNNTVAFAAKALKAQKADYQKIFRAEVKKASDPKQGAKKAGQIYRERYGATATARWKKALKRAK